MCKTYTKSSISLVKYQIWMYVQQEVIKHPGTIYSHLSLFTESLADIANKFFLRRETMNRLHTHTFGLLYFFRTLH